MLMWVVGLVFFAFLLLILKKEILCQHQRYMVPSQYQAVYPEGKGRTIILPWKLWAFFPCKKQPLQQISPVLKADGRLCGLRVRQVSTTYAMPEAHSCCCYPFHQCSNGLVLIESPPFFHFALSYSLNFPISYLKTRLLLKGNSAQVILWPPKPRT